MSAELAMSPAAASSGTGGKRPWLAAYPPGVPHDIDTDAVGTLVSQFDESVRRYPERPAVESFGVRRSYSDIAAASGAVASWLLAKGLRTGDRVAIMMPNVMAYPVVLFGALGAGATVVNVNPLYTPRELTFQLRDSGARILFVLENFASTVEAAGADLSLSDIVIVRPGDLLGIKGKVVDLVSRYVKKAVPPFRLPGSVRFADVLDAGRKAPQARPDVRPEDVAFLQYTGGTTGTAKGATLTHRNVAANVIQSEIWMRDAMGDGEHVVVTALPLYHIFALTACCMVQVRLGGCQLLIANPRDIPGFVKTLKTRRFTGISGVNTLYGALARAPGIREVDFSRLRVCVAGGMTTQAAVAKAWKDLTGRPIIEGYGLSETSPVVSTNRFDIAEFTGTVGYPMPSTDVSIRGEDGREVPAGEPGELCVRGPQVMQGYWQKPDETARVMTADGYLRTGDVAVLLPDGQLKLVDRIKDMILVSGFNVYPSEVEDVLASMPGVAEVAVIGRPSETAGEAVTAYIVRSEASVTEAAVTAWCRERLTGYKVPRSVVFRDTLPKTNVGKVLRRVLKEEVAGNGGGPVAIR